MEERYQKRGYLLEDFRLFHLQGAQGTDVDFHYHEFHKLLLLCSGSGGYVAAGRRYLLQAGDIVLVGSHCVHRPEFDPDHPYERVILYLSPEFLQRLSTADCQLQDLFSGERGHVLRLPEARRGPLFALAAELEQELARDAYGRVLLCSSLLVRLLVELARLRRSQPQPLPAPLEPSDGRMVEILRYLDGHLTEEVTVDSLAERFYISKYHLMRRFRRETGTTIHGYLTDRRLLLARDWIAHGMSATEACFSCGFHSYSSFSRAYGKRFGATPTGRARALEEGFE